VQRVRALQWAGALLVAGTAFWPALHVCAYPVQAAAGGPGWIANAGSNLREIPARELGTAIVESLRGPDLVGPLWDARRWYPWYLALPWGLALLLSGPGSRGRRRLVGGGLLLLGFGLIAFEAAYLRAEYASFLPGSLGRAEVGVAWICVVALLLYRRRGDRRVAAVEASVGAQALLGFVHGLTLPATMFRQWLPGRDAGTVVAAVLRNFPPAFWIGMLGLGLIFLPVYARRPRPVDGGREEDG